MFQENSALLFLSEGRHRSGAPHKPIVKTITSSTNPFSKPPFLKKWALPTCFTPRSILPPVCGHPRSALREFPHGFLKLDTRRTGRDYDLRNNDPRIGP
mmetsp:Transcript_32280/g.63925  ORF Transcript_32280/g.63925 Transcript_32280/m.63925 type:complete len:99 (-) Transcript_32280:672-968(-)